MINYKSTAGRIAIALFTAILLMWICCSCSVSKKSRSRSRSSVDSSATTSKVSEGKSQESRVTDRSKDSSYGSELVVEFDNDAQERANELAGPQEMSPDQLQAFLNAVRASAVSNDSLGHVNRIYVKSVSNDHRPVTGKLPGKVHKVKVNGKVIESNVPIKSATLRENGQVKQLDITSTTRADSGRQEEKGTVKVERKEQVKDTDSFSWKIPWWVYALLIVLPLVAWRLGWFKKEEDPFTVKYKRHG